MALPSTGNMTTQPGKIGAPHSEQAAGYRRTKTAKQEAVEGRELGSIVAEGLAKLVMHQGQWKADSPCRLEDAETALVRAAPNLYLGI